MPWYRSLWPRRHVTIPVIRLAGVIGGARFGGGLSLQALEPAIAAAFALKKAPAVAIVINSPGGSPVQSSLIAGRIRGLAREKNRPVLAFVEDMAASGGYWLALAGDEIFVDRASIVGSIGVVSAGFGLDRAIARLGIERRLHTTGPRKALLDPFRPEGGDDVAVLKELHADILEAFKAQVEERRADRLRLAAAELYSGRVWSGDKAVAHGLVDGIGEVRAILRQRFGETVRLRPVNRPRGWLRRRLGASRPQALEAAIAGLLPDLLRQLEEEALWRRHGL